MSANLHSVRVDRLTALQAGSAARVEALEYLIVILEDDFRDGTADLTLVIAGVDDSDDEWQARPGVEVAEGRKRDFVRTHLGQPLITVTYIRDPEGSVR